MSEVTISSLEPVGRFQFGWIGEVIFKPRKIFAKITMQSGNLWLTPMLLLTVTTLLYVATTGWLKQQAAAAGELPLPTGWEYYTPEQQQQMMQSLQAMQGPVFMYVLPALGSLFGIWIGWLLIGGMLHLALTLLGGRGSSAASNIVAWAGVAWAVRDMVRVVYLLITHQLIRSAGLSGFTPAGEGVWIQFLAQLLALVDIYLIWYIALILIGVRASSSLSTGKAVFGVLLTIALALLAQAFVGYLSAGLGNLTITRPFFF